MTKKILTFVVLLAVVSGCSRTVRYKVSPSLEAVRPYSVAVLPVDWSGTHPDEVAAISRLFRTMASERLTALNYRSVAIEETDAFYSARGAAALEKKTPAELAAMLGVDAVLFIHVTAWDEKRVVKYASLKMKATVELYSVLGERLWEATFATTESDVMLDTGPMELAVIKAYEPRIQRFIDAVFSTLPAAVVPEARPSYFEWLP